MAPERADRRTRTPSHLLPLLVAAAYGVVGVGWIVLSDRVLAGHLADPALLTRLQTIKGLAFVGGSALLLYVLARRAFATARRSQEAAHASRRALETVLRNLPGFAYRCRNDEHWTMEEMSAGCEPLTGYPAEAFIGNAQLAFADIIHPDDQDHVWRDVQAALERNEPFQLVYRLRTADGHHKWVWEQGRRAAMPGERGERIAGLIIDITQWKVIEDQFRQAQKMEAVGQLTSGIAHDLNNLLCVIQGNADLAVTMLPPGQEGLDESVREIHSAASRGAGLVRQLLAFSRRADLRIVPTDLRTVVAEVAGMLDRILPDNVTVEHEIEEPVDVVRADPGAVQQILLNLATNARDAMPDGGRLVLRLANATLEAEATADRPWITPGRYVRLAVSDTGRGMDAATRQRIFDPFFTTKPPQVGTGLGMAMAYGLMKQQRGHIHVYSEPGRGTTVSLYFPPVAEEAVTPPAPAGPEEIRGGTETILVVEDDPALRATTTRLLSRFGYKVLAADNGRKALDVLERHRGSVDLVLSDVVMPAMGGQELYSILTEREEAIPFVFESGHAAAELREGGHLPSNVFFVQKPWTAQEILSAIRRALDHHSPS